MKLPAVGIGMLDQVMSSASNVLALFAIARVAEVELFGASTLAFAVLTAVLATMRGLLGTPLTLLANRPVQLRAELRYAATTAAIIGLAPAAVIVTIVLVTGSDPGLIAIALAAPLLLMQDVGRFYCVTDGRPHVALASDGFWALGSFALLASTWMEPGNESFALVTTTWALLALVALTIIAVPVRLSLGFRGYRTWLNSNIRARCQFGIEAAVGAASSLIVISLVTGMLGLVITAGLRGASTTMGPLSVLMSAIPLAVVPELRRRTDQSVASQWTTMRKIAIGMSLLSGSIGIVATLIPSSVGVLLLGESWSVVRVLLPITAIEYVGLAWLSAAIGVLRAQARSGALVRVRLVQAIATAAAGCAAAFAFESAQAVAVGFACAAFMTAYLARRMVFGRG